MAEITPYLMKNINLNTPKAQGITSRTNSKRFTPRYFIINLSKNKERILKEAKR